MLFEKIIEQLPHKLDGDWVNVTGIEGVGTDTRQSLEDKLFIPLVGESFDGHDFIDTAVKQGAKAALWQESYPRPKGIDPSFPLIRVADTLIGLQELARLYLRFVNPKVVAITGSNGKTTTKDLVYAVSRHYFKSHCTKGNFNNHIGLPLTVLAMPEATEVLILEMGMNHFGEIEDLTKIAQPDIAIITNIGESHIEHLGSREGIAKAKLEVTSQFKTKGLLIYDGDEPLLAREYPFEAKSVGFNRSNDYYISHFKLLEHETEFVISDYNHCFTVPLLGKHQAKNATYSFVVGLSLGLTVEQIQKGLEQIEVTQMRFEKQTGKNGVTIINDAYNASPTSMKVTIETLAQLEGYHEKVLVLGDMFELGENAASYHKQVGQIIPPEINCLYTIGENAKNISQATSIPSQHFDSVDELIKQLEAKQREGSVILFKASRGMRLEKIVDALLQNN